MFSFILYFLVILRFFSVINAECSTKKSASGEIKDYILCGYDKDTRPVISHTNLTKIMLDLKLRYFNYEDHSYTMTVDAWFTMAWDDHHLVWDPTDYDGVTEIHISSEDIWTPDISLYNKGDLSVGPRLFTSADCMVEHDGLVACLPVVEMEALCVPDVTYWPYDTQTCKVKVGSWIHRGEEIDFDLSDEIVFSEGYTPNAEWALVNSTAKRDPGNFFGGNSSYPSVIYTFVIKRHSGSATATTIIPVIALMSLVLMTLWLEPISSDRIYLSSLNIPCHILYLQHLTWEIPFNGDTVPHIVLFFRDSMLLCLIIILETLIVRRLLEIKMSAPSWLITSLQFLLNNKIGHILLFTDINSEIKGTANVENAEDSSNLVDDTIFISQKEWKILGLVLDRLCFVIYIIIYVSLLIMYLPK